MSHKKKHTVRTHHWYSGILTVKDYVFESFEEAIGHVKTSGASQAKIYDDNQNLVHVAETVDAVNSYA